MGYLVICFFFGLAGGVVGKLKGSSFWLWFAISAVIPFGGLIAALLYRWDREEPRRPCPRCGSMRMAHDALCTRCGMELEYPEPAKPAAAPAPR